MIIPIEVSARHIHLCQEDLERLFGLGYGLKKLKQLTQPCDFAAEETLDIKTDWQIIPKVRIVGPVREKTQVEISMTDAINLKISPVFRHSGDIERTPGIILIGPKGELKIEKGVIIPYRHIHCIPKEAKNLKIKNGDKVSVKVEGERTVTFHNVKIRVKKDYKLCMHIDTDEGNAAGIVKSGEGTLVKP